MARGPHSTQANINIRIRMTISPNTVNVPVTQSSCGALLVNWYVFLKLYRCSHAAAFCFWISFCLHPKTTTLDNYSDICVCNSGSYVLNNLIYSLTKNQHYTISLTLRSDHPTLNVNQDTEPFYQNWKRTRSGQVLITLWTSHWNLPRPSPPASRSDKGLMNWAPGKQCRLNSLQISCDGHILPAHHTNISPNRQPTQRHSPSAYQTHPLTISMTFSYTTDSMWVSICPYIP